MWALGGCEPLRSLESIGEFARNAAGLAERIGDGTPVKNCWEDELVERSQGLLVCI